MGDATRLRLGETVLAIGNPFGIGQTVTKGIVSATGRANLGIVDYEDFIQTDAAINPGNSGGALVNLRGELVGINTAIVSRSGGYQGIGFAIPSNMAKGIMAALLDGGGVARGFLGVTIQPIDRDLANALGMERAEGVLVSDVGEDTPAQRAGFARGDVILTLNDGPVRDVAGLRMAVASAGPDAEFSAEVLRDGRKRILTGKLDRLEEPNLPRAGASPVAAGLTLAPLDSVARERLKLPEGFKHGVLVQAVAPDSRAARGGLRPGDVVVEANRRPVRSPADLSEALKNERALLLVVRGGVTRYIAV